MTSASLRAGTTAGTSGVDVAGEGSARRSALASQNLPRATTSPPQATTASQAAVRVSMSIDAERSDGDAARPAVDLDTALARARDALFRLQEPGGYWWAELESNVTI